MILIEPELAKVFQAARLGRRELGRFLSGARAAIGMKGRVDVLISGDEALRRLNRDFRSKDESTDVLSFPASHDANSRSLFAGDLAISLDTAIRQAKRFRHSVDIEVRILMLHGLLHLAGMDHETDAGEMAEKESALRSELMLPAGLIQRSQRQRKQRTAQ